MKSMLSFAIAITLALSLASSALAGLCSTGASNLTTNGTHQFGLRSDGINLGKGQTVTLDCAAQMLEVRFRMIFPAEPHDGVAALQNGDVLKVTILKLDMTPVVSTTTVVAGAPGEQWLSFDFSSQKFRIAAGEYLIACTTEVPGTAFFRKGPHAVDGTLYTAVDGVWAEVIDQDAMFEMHWEPNSTSVATDAASWGWVKSRFE